MTPEAIVQDYFAKNYRVVFWPAIGDAKGPREKDWPHRRYGPDDYRAGYRVGLLTGVEVAPEKFLHDVDVDWAPGAEIAQLLLPSTTFVFGHGAKRVSHCFYTLPEPVASYKYEDVDKTCLIELRGTKADGDVGLQTMAPPSIWSKGDVREPLTFVKADGPTHIAEADLLKRRVALTAISMLLAKRFGRNGFGHEVRLAWAGFLLRAGVAELDLVAMGEAISRHCNNLEVDDVRKSIDSTLRSLGEGKKAKGGPALAKLFGHDGKAIISRINEWLGRESDFIRSDGVIVAKHQENIRRAIGLLGHELSYNEFSAAMLIDNERLEDPQWKALYLQIEREHRFSPPVDYFKMVIEDLALRNSFHPVKQYLDSLTWDGKKRIDRWLVDAAKAKDSPYVRAVSSIMLVAAVRRIYHPGAKYDEMVVWESPQGANKSSAAQALCPNAEWFSDDLRLNLHAQQLIEATLGKWIVEASDLAGKRKTEIEQLKAMLSRQRDGPARLAYAHFPVERPRHFILIGTTNASAYLNDSTGSRRFWPVTVTRFDIDWIRTNRDQLWAEAVVREASGESIRLNEDLWDAATRQQERRREVDPWEPILRRYVLTVEPGAGERRRIATNALWEALSVPVERRDRYGSVRISEIMQRFGFKRSRVRPEKEEVQVGFIQDIDALRLEEDDGEDDDHVPF